MMTIHRKYILRKPVVVFLLALLLSSECAAFQNTLSTSSTFIKRSMSSTTEDMSKERKEPPRSRTITVSTSIKVPFSAEVAFDNFSDITRQADFSPWLRKVEYLNPPPAGVDVRGKNWGETKWYMGFRGFSITWNSICTVLEKPGRIQWESTTGMKNFGEVVFEETSNFQTNVSLKMTFVAPRIAAAVFRRSSNIARFVENKMLYVSLKNFRDAVIEENFRDAVVPVEEGVSEVKT